MQDFFSECVRTRFLTQPNKANTVSPSHPASRDVNMIETGEERWVPVNAVVQPPQIAPLPLLGDAPAVGTGGVAFSSVQRWSGMDEGNHQVLVDDDLISVEACAGILEGQRRALDHHQVCDFWYLEC